MKVANKRSMQRYWLSFLPEKDTAEGSLSAGASTSMPSIYTSLRLEHMPRNRVAALGLLLTLVENGKAFFLSAGQSLIVAR